MPKVQLHELQADIRDARRFYAAGDIDGARKKLGNFKRRAERAVVEQQEAMSRELQRHLDLRNATLDTVKGAKALAEQIKKDSGEEETPGS